MGERLLLIKAERGVRNIDYKKEDLSGIYEEMAELLGLEITLKIYEHYKGLNIVFPSRLLKREYVIKQLQEEYDGSNLRALSRKYCYSERWLRSMIKCSCDDSD